MREDDSKALMDARVSIAQSASVFVSNQYSKTLAGDFPEL